MTFLDSRRQLERVQIIRGVQTTIPDYVINNYKNANIVSYENIDKITNHYDFILCANVLSAIPCESTIHKVLSAIRELLKSDGEALIVNQYKVLISRGTRAVLNICMGIYTKTLVMLSTMVY